MKISDAKTAQRLLALVVLVAAVAAPVEVRAQPAGVDADALKVLRRMTDYLSDIQQFSVDAQTTLEAVLVSGQKIQFDAAAKLTVQRPNKLRAERSGDIVSQAFYYDGKTLTLYNPTERYYASVPAPDTIEAMLDFARDSLDIFAPASDLVLKDAYARLMQDVVSGFVVGKAAIGGAKCDHLAFSGPVVDWQIWIQDGDRPLPRKYVITTKYLAGAPQYTVIMSNWNLAPGVSASRFSFTPPQGATKIDFLELGHMGASK